MKKQTKLENNIRTIQLIRRLGSVGVVFIFTVLASKDLLRDHYDKWKKNKLTEIYNNGVHKYANIEENYKINTYTKKYSSWNEYVFTYSFEEKGEIYTDEYEYTKAIPTKGEKLEKLFTVHYLKDNPNKNSLNIEYELKNIRIRNASTLELVFEYVITFILLIIFIRQIRALLYELKNMDEPIETPDYLK